MFLKKLNREDLFQSYNSKHYYTGFSGGFKKRYIDQYDGGSNLRVEIQIGKTSNLYLKYFSLNEKSFWNYSIPKNVIFPIILEEEMRGAIISI